MVGSMCHIGGWGPCGSSNVGSWISYLVWSMVVLIKMSGVIFIAGECSNTGCW